MARPRTDDLQKHTLNLRAGDMEALQQLFPGKSPTVIIRRMISKFVDRSRAIEKITPEEPINF